MSVIEEVSLEAWPIERLEAEITLVAAHLAAAECRWLQLVAEFERRQAWGVWGCASAAHWLNFHLRVGHGSSPGASAGGAAVVGVVPGHGGVLIG